MCKNLLATVYYRLNPAAWRIRSKKWLSCRRLVSYIYFKLKRRLRLDLSFYPPGPSDIPIDVFMPALEKDADMLRLSVKAVHQNVMHPISNIYIVAPPDSQVLKGIASDEGCIFVSEEEVVPLDIRSIKYQVRGYDRSGWIYKMLCNLAADTVCKERYILVLDADTIFIRPQIFVYRGRPLFNLSDEYHCPYFEANARLLELRPPLCRAFTTHYMLFDADVLRELRTAIATKSQLAWYDAIVKAIDTTELSGFSDYELYGSFYLRCTARPCILNYWSNISLTIDRYAELDALVKEYEATHASLSLHSYQRQRLQRITVTSQLPTTAAAT